MENTKKNKKSELMQVICPKCKNRFGLDIKVVEHFSAIHLHYKCPYCGYEAGIRE